MTCAKSPHSNQTSLWAVIPALNESATLRQIVVTTLEQLPNVVVVDDASSDDTWRVVADLPVVLLRNDRRLGKAGSLWRGFRHALVAGATGVLTLDGDGQHDPRDIERLQAQYLIEPHAMILGARSSRSRWSRPLRYLANCAADTMVQVVTSHRIKDTQSGFRLYPATLLEQVQDEWDVSLRRSFAFETQVLLDAVRLEHPIRVVAIASPRTQAHRASHFKPFMDSLEISKIVVRHLFYR